MLRMLRVSVRETHHSEYRWPAHSFQQRALASSWFSASSHSSPYFRSCSYSPGPALKGPASTPPDIAKIAKDAALLLLRGMRGLDLILIHASQFFRKPSAVALAVAVAVAVVVVVVVVVVV